MHLIIPLSIVALTSLWTGQACAQDLTGTLKKIKDIGAITLGHRESSTPFSYYNDKQQAVPMAVKALDNLEAAGIERPVDEQGEVKKILSAEDSGYFSAAAVAGLVMK